MRHYQCDSPEAAARVVAACLLSDGHVGMDEIEALERHGIEQRLSLHPGQFMAVMQTLCEDLTSAAYLNWGDACRLDAVIVEQLAARRAGLANAARHHLAMQGSHSRGSAHLRGRSRVSSPVRRCVDLAPTHGLGAPTRGDQARACASRVKGMQERMH